MTKVFFKAVCVLSFAAAPVSIFAHEGPPYSVAEWVTAGPYELSVWADADVGDGALWVVVSPASSGRAASTTVSGTWRARGTSRSPLVRLAGLNLWAGFQAIGSFSMHPLIEPGHGTFSLELKGRWVPLCTNSRSMLSPKDPSRPRSRFFCSPSRC